LSLYAIVKHTGCPSTTEVTVKV